MALNIIAREGNFVWQADSEEAGPYRLGWTTFMFRMRSFGVRGLHTHRQGSIAQREAFRQSKAAFECCRFYVESLCCGMQPEPDCGMVAIELAAKSARAEYARWQGQFGVYAGAERGYLAAVLDRFEAAVKSCTFPLLAEAS